MMVFAEYFIKVFHVSYMMGHVEELQGIAERLEKSGYHEGARLAREAIDIIQS